MKKKTFDCVDMMHQGAARLQRKLAALTPEERAQYWKQQSAALRKAIRAARQTEQESQNRKSA